MKTNIDKTAVAELQVDNVLRNVINGKSFDVNFLETAVADQGVIQLLIETGSNTNLHFKLDVVCEGKSIAQSYIDGDYVTGTLEDQTKLTSFLRNSTKEYSKETTFSYAPTVNTAGTLRANLLVLGGTGPQSTGGTSGTSESIVGPNNKFLIQVQNKSGQAKDMQIILECFEELI